MECRAALRAGDRGVSAQFECPKQLAPCSVIPHVCPERALLSQSALCCDVGSAHSPRCPAGAWHTPLPLRPPSFHLTHSGCRRTRNGDASFCVVPPYPAQKTLIPTGVPLKSLGQSGSFSTSLPAPGILGSLGKKNLSPLHLLTGTAGKRQRTCTYGQPISNLGIFF